MKNEDLQEMRKEYIQDITLEVSKMIAKSSKLKIFFLSRQNNKIISAVQRPMPFKLQSFVIASSSSAFCTSDKTN